MIAQRTALRSLWLLIAATVVVGDRITKDSIHRSLSPYDSVSVLPNWLRIVHSENPGAAFGILAESSPALRTVVLIGVSSLVLIFVAVSLWNRMQSVLAGAGLALILGGAFGNLYDRVVHRTVTDFIEVYHGDWSFPAFNVADSAITVGAALLLIDLVSPRRKHAAQAH